MNENIQALLQKIAESEELQSRFAKVSTPEEAYEIAKEIQGGYTKEEFLEAAKALAEAMDEDIGDEDLASAAGGLDESAAAEETPSLAELMRSSKVPAVTGQATGGLTKKISFGNETKTVVSMPRDSKTSKALSI